jgi:hypothetical protein
LCCVKLRLEFCEAKLELNSYEEIIKLLQEEISEKGFPIQPTSSILKQYRNGEQTQVLISKGTWINVTSNQHNKSRFLDRNHIQLIPQTVNRYKLLANLNEESESPRTLTSEDTAQSSRSFRMTQQKMIQGVNTRTRKKHKIIIIIIGDIHVRTVLLNYSITYVHFKVSSFVKSGAGMSVITNTAKEEIKN